MVLSTMLWRTKDKIARLPSFGYWLADIPYSEPTMTRFSIASLVSLPVSQRTALKLKKTKEMLTKTPTKVDIMADKARAEAKNAMKSTGAGGAISPMRTALHKMQSGL